MEFSATGTEAIPIILLSIAVPFIIFILLPIIVIRTFFKAIRGKLPPGTTLKELQQIATQFPKGIDWEQMKKDWDIKVNRETGKFTIKRKTAVGQEGDSTLNPTEMQVTELGQLPAVLRKLINETKAGQSSEEGIQFSATNTPTSASSKINGARSNAPISTQSPKTYEIIQLLKRIVIVLLILGLFSGLRNFFT